MITPFNSAFETGVRSLVILEAAYPESLDVQRLVYFDYFVVHSGDLDGPPSLHAPVPMRSGELVVRRSLIERGLMVMMGRGLVRRISTSSGFDYEATDIAESFLSMLTEQYHQMLRSRAAWAIDIFLEASLDQFLAVERKLFSDWSIHFQTGNDVLESRS